MNRPSSRRQVDDTGASLLIVLAFVTFVGLIVGALLSYSGTSLNGTASTMYRTNVSLDADGATKAAINQVRNGTYDNNGSFDTCDLAPSDSATATMTFPGSNTGSSTKVTCAGGPGTGVDGGLVPINSSNRPGSALLTLGVSGSEPGLDVQASGSGTALRIKGQVYINSNATVGSSGGVEVQNAQFHARTGCSGNVTSDVPKNCNDSSTGSAWSDPGYSAPDASSLTLQSAPATSCSSAPQTIQFSPGYYDDVDILNNLTTPSQCAGKTLWFQPGTYFFDFHNGEGAPLSNSSHEWTVSRDVKIVAGTRSSNWTNLNASPTIPGACVSPLTTVNNNGVEFVFGGDSRINMTNGAMEICGDYSATHPAISVYGAKTGTDATHTNRTAFGTANSTPTATPAVKAFTSPAKAYSVDNDPAVGDLDATGSNPDTVGITLQGFVPPNDMPAGSLLNAATLDIVHRDYTTQNNVFDNGALSVDITPNRAGATSIWSTTFNATPTNVANAPFTTSSYTALLSALQTEAHNYGLANGLNVTFKANVAINKKATVSLDGVKLTLTWKTPAVRAQSGCAITAPAVVNYNNNGGCYLININGNSAIAYFQGTTYAPNAAIYVKLNNVSQQVFKSGLVVRAVKVDVTGSFQFTGPVFEIPSDAFGPGPTDVYFTTYVCPKDKTCSTDPAVSVGNWTKAVTARVAYTDATPGAPSAGHRDVQVKSWTTYR